MDLLQLFAGPKDRPFGPHVESLGVEQRPLIVIAQQTNRAIHDQVHAFARVGTVPHNITQAVNFIDALGSNVGEDGLQCLEIAMNIADDRPFHDVGSLMQRLGKNGSRRRKACFWWSRQCAIRRQWEGRPRGASKGKRPDDGGCLRRAEQNASDPIIVPRGTTRKRAALPDDLWSKE